MVSWAAYVPSLRTYKHPFAVEAQAPTKELPLLYPVTVSGDKIWYLWFDLEDKSAFPQLAFAVFVTL